MSYLLHITPLEIKEFVLSEGWTLVKEAIQHNFYVLYKESINAQISMAIDKNAPDYYEAIERSIIKLSSVYNCEIRDIIERIKTFDKDIFSLRFVDSCADDGYIPLPSITKFIDAVQQILLSSTCMVRSPALHFTRPIKEAKGIINHAQFRHTNIGSFILNIACPLKEDEDDQYTLEGCSATPLARKVTERIALSVDKIVNSIKEDSYTKFIADLQSAEEPLISSNFCDAIYELYNDEKNNNVEFQFHWSPKYERTVYIDKVFIKNEYFSYIKDISIKLRKKEGALNGTFIGTVETLNGDLNKENNRSGEVQLNLFSTEQHTKIIRAKTFLDADDYKKAYIAHGTSKKFVKVTGKLLPGRSPRTLVDVESFEIME